MTIPTSISKVEGANLRTQEVQISVSEPEKFTDLTWSWSLGAGVLCGGGSYADLALEIDREIHNYLF